MTATIGSHFELCRQKELCQCISGQPGFRSTYLECIDDSNVTRWSVAFGTVPLAEMAVLNWNECYPHLDLQDEMGPTNLLLILIACYGSVDVFKWAKAIYADHPWTGRICMGMGQSDSSIPMIEWARAHDPPCPLTVSRCGR